LKAPSKRGRGRPSLSGETGERYQVTIPPTVADKLRRFGEGSLSGGIIKAAGLIMKRRERNV
jgi:hypothetical protein